MCLVDLSVCLFHQKPSRFYPYVSVHVSRSAMQPIATVSHIAWSVYLCIFRYVYALYLLMTHVLWSVCLFVCVLGWFVCLSFPSKYQLISNPCFSTCIGSVMWPIASVPHTVVCLSDFRHTYQHRTRNQQPVLMHTATRKKRRGTVMEKHRGTIMVSQ